MIANRLQSVVVGLLVSLKEDREVQQWLLEDLSLGEQQRDQQASNSPVPVDKRVNRLELGVEEPNVNEIRNFVGLVDVLLPPVQGLLHFVRRRGNKARVPGRRS